MAEGLSPRPGSEKVRHEGETPERLSFEEEAPGLSSAEAHRLSSDVGRRTRLKRSPRGGATRVSCVEEACVEEALDTENFIPELVVSGTPWTSTMSGVSVVGSARR